MIPVGTVFSTLVGVRRVLLAIGVALLVLTPALAQPSWLPPGAVLTPPPGAVIISDGRITPPVGVRSLRPTEAEVAAPLVTVQLSAPAQSEPDKDIAYRVVVANTSRASAHHVLVKVALSKSAKVIKVPPDTEQVSPENAPPEKATLLSWKVGTLAPGGQKEFSFTVGPTGNDEISCCARVQFEHGQCVRTQISKDPAPAVVARGKSGIPKLNTSGNGKNLPIQNPDKAKGEIKAAPTGAAILKIRLLAENTPRNETSTHRIEVANVGTATAKDLVIEATPDTKLIFLDSKPPVTGKTPLTWTLPDLAPKATVSVEFLMAGDKTGTVRSKAVVRAAGGLREETEKAIQITPGMPILDVRVSGPAVRAVGRDATYRVTVRNSGDKPAEAVELEDGPAQDQQKKDVDPVAYVKASDDGKIEHRSVRWYLGVIPPGQERTVLVTLQPKLAGEFTYTLYAFRKKEDAPKGKELLAHGTTKTRFVDVAPLEIEIDQSSGPATSRVGQEVGYVVRVLNGKAIQNQKVKVTLELPPGVEVRYSNGKRPADPKLIHLDELPNLGAAGQAHEMFLKANKPGTYRLIVTASSEETKTTGSVRMEESVVFEK